MQGQTELAFENDLSPDQTRIVIKEQGTPNPPAFPNLGVDILIYIEYKVLNTN